ncbi:putative integral membrane protein [Acanthocheilonema viteae]
MEYNYEPRCCFRLIPLQICCKLVIIVDILLHLLICAFFFKAATFEMIFVPFGIVQLMLTVLSMLFYIGIVKKSEKFMIPMIVAKIIMMLIVCTMTILTWIAFALSLFLLIHLESPIKRLSPSTYLGLQSVAMTVCLIILIAEGSILHAGYKHIKRKIDHRNIDEEFVPFVNGSSLAMKPTAV